MAQPSRLGCLVVKSFTLFGAVEWFDLDWYPPSRVSSGVTAPTSCLGLGEERFEWAQVGGLGQVVAEDGRVRAGRGRPVGALSSSSWLDTGNFASALYAALVSGVVWILTVVSTSIGPPSLGTPPFLIILIVPNTVPLIFDLHIIYLVILLPISQTHSCSIHRLTALAIRYQRTSLLQPFHYLLHPSCPC
ncbi:hypothetical protein EDC04DRAFT_2635870 [Pisolithus marmoratus]|nr:hypothetical protein EDC04DRAFT_2635870 [Pisolithus marmoratus]